MVRQQEALFTVYEGPIAADPGGHITALTAMREKC